MDNVNRNTMPTAQQGGNRQRVFSNQSPLVVTVNPNAPVTIKSITWFSGHKQKVVASSNEWTATTVSDHLTRKNVSQNLPVSSFAKSSKAVFIRPPYLL